MKSPSCFLTLLLLATLAAGAPARSQSASSGGPPGFGPAGAGHPGDREGGSCRPNDLRLIATADAPAGAFGQVKIDLSDAAAPALDLQVGGLAAGTYTVSATTTADATATALGTFDVLAASAAGTPTAATLSLPAGFDPKTLASVQVADASGTVLLSAVQHDPTEGERLPDFHLQATATAPAGARGMAQIDLTSASAPALDVEVHGLAPGTYTVATVSISSGNSTTLGTIQVAAATSGATDATASLALPAGLLPTDIFAVQVLDAASVLLLTGDGACRGGDISGSESLHQRIALTATADAPAGLTGHAELDAHDRKGVSSAVLEVDARGLAAGTYTVSVTSEASDTPTALGTITATGSGKDHLNVGTIDSIAFPAGFNPLDIATVQVADANGVVLLTGDFSSPQAGATAYIATVKTTAGTAAPDCTGSATVATQVSGSTVLQSFALTAKNAPPKATLTLKINGVVTGQVTTSRSGGISIGKLPKGTQMQKITSVTLQTSSGAKVLGAYF